MNTPPPTRSAYHFGEFRLDPDKRLLWRNGTQVPLTPRVFDTLLYLVSHNGELLGKERLMDALWPDTVVEENNLTQNISTLRRIFGDTPGSHRFIATVPGRGYRFVAEVQQAERAMTENPSPRGATDLPPRVSGKAELEVVPRKRTPKWVFAAGALLLGGVVALIVAWQSGALQRFSPAGAHPPATEPIRVKSIAVLPFENLSDDNRSGYFAAAIQDEILSNLARLADLKVISRTSASLYKTGNPRNIREIGQQLGVAHLLEGSVQHSGNRVRVNAQLIDARTDAHLWAHTYDREVADVLGIQTEIATAIADQLKAKISPGEKAGLDLKPTENAEAYLLYLRGREIETRFRAEEAERQAAVKFYEQACQLDPGFALARARLSILITNVYQSTDAARTAQARAEAEAALRLRPDLGEAQLALAYTYFWGRRDYNRALTELQRAGELLPNSAEVPLTAAYIYKWQNKFRERVAALRRAEILDPRDLKILALQGTTFRWLREWEEAMRTVDRMRAIEPNDRGLHFESWRAQDEFRKTGDIEVLKKANALDMKADDPDRVNIWLHVTAFLERDFEAAERHLAQIPERFFETDTSAHPKIVHTALLAVARGTDPAAANAALESARERIEQRLAPFGKAPSAEGADLRANLALIYALLGRKDDAIRTAREAADIETGAVEKSYCEGALALVYARTGEADRAIDLIERLLTVPMINGRRSCLNITLADLKWQWVWDPLRSHPRFQKILAGPEPKTIY